MLRILTDRGTEYCGKVESHPYELYLGIEDIDHTKTKANHPQTNGICERFHKVRFMILPLRKKIDTSLKALQTDANHWVHKYNAQRPHSGKHCYGKTCKLSGKVYISQLKSV